MPQLRGWQRSFVKRFHHGVYLFGLCYTVGTILLLAGTCLCYVCPHVYGSDHFPKTLIFASVVLGELFVNLVLFTVRAGYNRVDALLRHDHGSTLPIASYITLSQSLLNDGRNFATKFCFSCQATVPKLCHHCPLCNYCVFKRDHHCFFMGGCVGFGNQRHFIVFLLWAFLGAAYALCLTACYFNKFEWPLWPFGWLDCLLPVYLTKRVIFWDWNHAQLCLIGLMSLAFSSTVVSAIFFFTQWMFVLTGRSMIGYFQMTDLFLGKEKPTFGQRVALVFGQHWWLNFLFPLPYLNRLDKDYRRMLYNHYVKVL
uniref:Palmitoyltransferase n=1 Tax=Trichuris muris TaxID=70415 RepID=A0A5S6R4Z5_TRIMR